MLFLWWKYRLGSDSAHTYILCISFLRYVDLIPFLTGEYLLLGLLCRILKKEENFTGGFGIDEPITRSDDDLLGRKIYAHDAAEKLLATNTEKNAFTFGIVAPWGMVRPLFVYDERAYR